MPRARACIKCREYIVIKSNDVSYLDLEKIFEGKHRGHTLITLDIEEVKGTYSVYDAGE